MTKKQTRKLAKEIYDNELIRQDPSSSKEEKSRAEARIMTLTNQIMALNNGMEVMLEVDEIIQGLAKKK